MNFRDVLQKSLITSTTAVCHPGRLHPHLRQAERHLAVGPGPDPDPPEAEAHRDVAPDWPAQPDRFHADRVRVHAVPVPEPVQGGPDDPAEEQHPALPPVRHGQVLQRRDGSRTAELDPGGSADHRVHRGEHYHSIVEEVRIFIEAKNLKAKLTKI